MKALLLLCVYAGAVHAAKKRYYVNANDIGATTLPAYLTTGDNPWDKATLTTIDWATWENLWAASTLSTALTTPTLTESSLTTTSASTSASTTSLTTTSSTSSAAPTKQTSVDDRSESDRSRDLKRAKIVIGVVCGVVGFVFLMAAILTLLCFLQKKKSELDDEKSVTIREVQGFPGSTKLGLITAGAGAGVAAAGAVEVLGDTSHISSPDNDNASTITGSFALLSEKLKEIQEQYLQDGDDLSTFSTLDGDTPNGAAMVSLGQRGHSSDSARSSRSIGSHESGDNSPNGSEVSSTRLSISSYRSSLHEVAPSVNNRSPRTMSPRQTVSRSDGSRESDDDLYVDRKLDTSEEDRSELKPSAAADSPNTVTTGTSIATGVDSEAASFEQDQNFPNKYNNFATELMTKSKKPAELGVVNEEEEKHAGSPSQTSQRSTGSKKRASQFDFEPEEEEEEEQRERQPSAGSFFTETM